MKTIAFYTLGCKVNQYETNAMSEKFINKGYKITEFDDKADIYVINTCTVTNMSDKKSRQIIRKVKQINPNSLLVVTGCYAEVSKKELEKINQIDLIVGNKEKIHIVEIVENHINNRIEKLQETEIYNEYQDFGITTYTEKTRAVIKIEDGCDNFCSYCIIPYAKGRVRSRKLDDVIEEVKQNVNNGVKEIIITGIHIASYGKDFKENISLIDLLEEINKVKGLKRIRIGSLEPNIITPEFVTRLQKLEKLCNHFHLSLQSGCDETLKRMNRKYTSKQFEEKVNLLRKSFLQVALTTDIIVGFPAETEEEFNITYNYLKKIKFTKMHVFKYSQRSGTIAAKMPMQVSPIEKERRSKKLIQLSNKNEKEFLDEYIEKEVDVLFEQDGKGHTTNYIIVNVEEKNIENQIRKVIIKTRNNLELEGNTL